LIQAVSDLTKNYSCSRLPLQEFFVMYNWEIGLFDIRKNPGIKMKVGESGIETAISIL